jgi:transposase
MRGMVACRRSTHYQAGAIGDCFLSKPVEARSHLCLTPRAYQSGETDRAGQISKCGDQMLRHLLYEAASALMTRARKWSRLRA